MLIYLWTMTKDKTSLQFYKFLELLFSKPFFNLLTIDRVQYISETYQHCARKCVLASKRTHPHTQITYAVRTTMTANNTTPTNLVVYLAANLKLICTKNMTQCFWCCTIKFIKNYASNRKIKIQLWTKIWQLRHFIDD